MKNCCSILEQFDMIDMFFYSCFKDKVKKIMHYFTASHGKLFGLFQCGQVKKMVLHFLS